MRVIPGRTRQPGRIGRLFANRRRVLNIVSLSMIVASLLAVVVAQAFLTNGQVRLSTLQHDLSLEQSAHRQAELAVSGLETPSRIVGAATSQGMVHPAAVIELPYVSLSTPLPTPNVTPAPAAPPATSTAGTSSSTAGGAGGTTISGGTSSGSVATGATAASGANSSTTTATSTP